MTCRCVVQRDDSSKRMTGDASVFQKLAQLTDLNLEYTAFTGVLRTGPLVTRIRTVGPQHDSFKLGSTPGDKFTLESLEMTDGSMAGAVPLDVLAAPVLAHLSLRGNKFSSVPQDWGVTQLRFLDLSNNALEVCSTCPNTCNTDTATTRI
jgi:hypothetical protein